MKPSIHVVSWFRDSLDPSEHTPAWANDPATPIAGPGTPAAASDNAAAAPNLPSPVPHPQVSVECLALKVLELLRGYNWDFKGLHHSL